MFGREPETEKKQCKRKERAKGTEIKAFSREEATMAKGVRPKLDKGRQSLALLTLLMIFGPVLQSAPPPPASSARSPISPRLQEGVMVGEFYSLAVTPNGRFIAAGVRRSAPLGVKEEKAVDVFDAQTGRIIGFYGTPRPFEGIAECLSFSGDGRLFAVGCQDGRVYIWDTRNGALLRSLVLPAPVETVAFSRDGKWLATGSRDGTVRLWQKSSRGWSQPVLKQSRVFFRGDDLKPIENLPPPERLARFLDPTIFKKPPFVKSVVFSPDSQWLAVAGTGDLNGDTVSEGIAIVRVGDGKVISVLSGHGKGVALRVSGHSPVSWVNSLTISRDGRWLASAGWDATVRLWDLSAMKEARRFVSPRTPLGAFATRVYNSVAISPDGSLIAAGGFGGRVDVWNAKHGGLVRSLRTENIVEAVAFAPNGQLLYSGGWDGYLRAWAVGSWRQVWSQPASGRSSERTNPPPLL